MHMRLKKIIMASFLSTAIITSSVLSGGLIVKAKTSNLAKNVIILIPDGMNIESTTLTRWYNNGKNLAMDEILSGLVKTDWANGPITDSAPAGTAYSTGRKTDDGHVAVTTKSEGEVPIATVLEGAKLKGKATGIVFTCEAMHATPADFVAHAVSRNNYNSLMKQEIYNGLDVVLGGGDGFFSADPKLSGRKDGKDLKATIKTLGYDYLTTRDQLLNSKSNKLWGMFAQKDLQYDLDRKELAPNEPTLEEMTKKSIDVLSKDEDGFFLMVEGSKVDWAAHANDPAGVVGDILAFDRAVKQAVDFAKKDGNTVVIVAADHGTGGMALGGGKSMKGEYNSKSEKDYSKLTFADTVDKLKPVKATSILIDNKTWCTANNARVDEAKIKEVFNLYYGINDLTTDEIAAIKAASIGNAAPIVNKILSYRANIGWTTGGHVGGTVALYCYSPDNINKLSGLVDNNKIGQYMADVMNLNLIDTTKNLFNNTTRLFDKTSISIDNSDIENPVQIIKEKNHTLKLYANTNLYEIDGAVNKSKGVIVYNDKDFYIAKHIVDEFNKALNK